MGDTYSTVKLKSSVLRHFKAAKEGAWLPVIWMLKDERNGELT